MGNVAVPVACRPYHNESFLMSRNGDSSLHQVNAGTGLLETKQAASLVRLEILMSGIMIPLVRYWEMADFIVKLDVCNM